MSNAVASIMQTIGQTPFKDVIMMPMVQEKYIANYNQCNNSNDGELMWHRNLIFMKQAISGLTCSVDPFSVYACICTMAVYGYSAVPDDEEMYLVPYNGKLTISRQAGAFVKRLIDTEQIVRVITSKLVYAGDTYSVKNDTVVEHVELYKSNRIIAGYVKFELPNGSERHVTFRASDWESWRSKSPQKDGANWVYKSKDLDGSDLLQPMPGFLLNKILLHACKDKGRGWKPGRGIAPTVEVFQDTLNDEAGDGVPEYQRQAMPASEVPQNITPHEVVQESATQKEEHDPSKHHRASAANSFATPTPKETVTFDSNEAF